jgi:hypothetical protein
MNDFMSPKRLLDRTPNCLNAIHSIYRALRRSPAISRATLIILCGATPLIGSAAPVFKKGADQFCIANLSAEQQSAFYSRIVAMGASYTHGCMACDSVKNWQGYTEMTDDQFWIRRNYLGHFFAQTTWKNPNEFRYEKMYVLENDGRTKPAALVSAPHLKNNGYTGEWLLDPASGSFGFLSAAFKQRIESADPQLAAEAAKVGGPFLQKNKLTIRTGPSRGILMRTVPGQYAASGALPKSVYDLSVDGGFLGLIFAVHGDAQKTAALEKTGWRDQALRDGVVKSLANRMSELDPTIIMGVDLLFWDTVFESIYRLREAGPKSPLVRLALGIVGLTPVGKQMFDQQRRQNQRADMYRALSMVSVGMNGRPPVPVLLARLADNPIEKFRDKNYMPVIATIFGQFFEQVTGVNFISEILVWLNKINFLQSASGLQMAGGDLDIPELGLKLSRSDVTELRKTLATINEQLPPQDEQDDGQNPDDGASLTAADISKNARYSFDPVGGARVTLFPAFTQGIVSRLLMQALVDVPGFINGLSQTFKEVNEQVTAVGKATDNNVHELDVNEFYENLGYFLNPRTAHPSVLGATRMARMVERTTCGGRSL